MSFSFGGISTISNDDTPVAGVMFSKFKTYIKNGHQGDFRDHKDNPKK